MYRRADAVEASYEKLVSVLTTRGKYHVLTILLHDMFRLTLILSYLMKNKLQDCNDVR